MITNKKSSHKIEKHLKDKRPITSESEYSRNPGYSERKKREDIPRTPRDEHPRDIKSTKTREKQSLRRVKSTLDSDDKANKITTNETKPKQKLDRQRKLK